MDVAHGVPDDIATAAVYNQLPVVHSVGDSVLRITKHFKRRAVHIARRIVAKRAKHP